MDFRGGAISDRLRVIYMRLMRSVLRVCQCIADAAHGLDLQAASFLESVQCPAGPVRILSKDCQVMSPTVKESSTDSAWGLLDTQRILAISSSKAKGFTR